MDTKYIEESKIAMPTLASSLEELENHHLRHPPNSSKCMSRQS